MSHHNCPLKQASLDAPNSPALIAKDFSITYRELDVLADQYRFAEGRLISTLPHHPHEFIPLLFACMRQNASLCPINLRLPNPQAVIDKLPQTTTPQSVLLFTSGSTSVPKIAVLSFKSLLINAAYSIELEPNDRFLLSLPLYHVGGLGIILRCILARAAIVIDKNNPTITHLSFVPTQLFRESPTYKHLKCILLGGAPISSIPSYLPVYATYGLTEMGSMVLLRKNPPRINGHYYLGYTLPKRELCLAPDGEILVRGETLFDGYLNQPQFGWFHTGDMGRNHPIQGIAIIGRKDWQFISGGENIQPEEIEQTLFQFSIESVIIPKADPEFGARPVAIVQRKEITLEQIQKILSNSLPKYKIPIALFYVDEWPRKGIKIDRLRLIEQYKHA